VCGAIEIWGYCLQSRILAGSRVYPTVGVERSEVQYDSVSQQREEADAMRLKLSGFSLAQGLDVELSLNLLQPYRLQPSLRRSLDSNFTTQQQPFAVSEATMLTPAAEIPSVSLLYRVKRLLPAPADPKTVTPKPSQSFNDRIGLVSADITKLEVDAIVNAANNSLLGGGGVDGAIHRAGGPMLLRECRTLGGCDTGSAKITDAYNLPCKKVIHAVGPVYDSDSVEESERDLAGCYTTSLELAVENGCKTVAFSALSTGVYGYPSHDAAPVAIRAVKEFLEGEHGDKLNKVVFVTFVTKDSEAYNSWLP
jgi:O-acetyl-ADP-ribose deacetylase